MKSKILKTTFAFICILCSAFSLTSCLFENVVPCAWVYLKTDGGYTRYTSDMYAQTMSHIYYFDSEADASDNSNYSISMTFYPRILGSEDVEVDGVMLKTMLVDISSYIDMSISIKKSSAIYSSEKEIYINGEKANITSTDSSSHLVIYLIQNVNFTRGNPGGHINGVVNAIEYK